MPTTLGISCFYHDAAAAIVRDGDIIAAAQEERFSRIKGDASFPVSAVSYCLEEANMSVQGLDSVVFYDKPLRTFDRLLTGFFAAVPSGLRSWLTAIPEWISTKLHTEEAIRSVLGYDGELLYTPHHLAHAASAYLPSPFDSAAILTVDGVGEWATASYGIGEGSEVRLLKELRFPDSLGLLYSAFTYFCGFKVNSGEYKLMGLAPYGSPRYLNELKENVASIREDGTIQLNMEYFGFLDTLKMTTRKFERLFDGKARPLESRITRREMDLARSVQVLTEEAMLKKASWVQRETGCKSLCLAGGVALNCVANGRILRESAFDDIWIQPAAGDAGGALGAALAVQYGYHGIERTKCDGYDRQKGSYLGPGFSENEIAAFLDSKGIPYRRLSKSTCTRRIAEAMARGRIVGLFYGRMEFGPRALGARSILGDPRREDTQSVMNLKIKYRESFRPFAPSVLAHRVSDYFEMDCPSPYMLLVAPVKSDRCLPQDDNREDDDLIKKVNCKRSDIPSVTHFDYSARVQTVHEDTNPMYFGVLSEFERITGCGVVVNTSFNVRGEPIVCTPQDAYLCFMRTEMDFLYLDGFWLDKTKQDQLVEKDDWRETFALD